ncbi:MAG: CinA family protein [Methanomassiliicoccaceae archaeon]|nr:CinA family protein [Methanomassiliicoccaceae archaeon]
MSDVNARTLADIFFEKGLTLSLAESCTGGKVASLITDVPDVSSFFKGCAVTYSNLSKERILNVSNETLVTKGAVSAEAAEEMAEGAKNVFGTDIAASATGIAGPSGGTELKPVGTVYIAVTDGIRTECKAYFFKGCRDEIKDSTAKSMMRMIIDFIR